jgi:hypothetical protein
MEGDSAVLSRLRSRLTYANVVSTSCLFIVLGGTSYAVATGSIDSREIKNNTVGSKDIRDNDVRSRDVRNQSLRAQDFAPGQLPAGPAGPTGATGPPGPATGPAGGALTGNFPDPGLAPPEPWHEVAAGSTTNDACANATNTAIFCSEHPTTLVWVPWKNFGPSLATVAFYKDQLGIVHLKGVVSSQVIRQGFTPTRSSIFRLPQGYLPETTRIFASVGAADMGSSVEQEAAGRVDVQADGLVVTEADCGAAVSNCSANGPYFTLDGISFRPDE